MSRFTHSFRKCFVTEKQTPQLFPLLECMSTCMMDHAYQEDNSDDQIATTIMMGKNGSVVPMLMKSIFQKCPIIMLDRYSPMHYRLRPIKRGHFSLPPLPLIISENLTFTL